jgi:hypothetical protein
MSCIYHKAEYLVIMYRMKFITNVLLACLFLVFAVSCHKPSSLIQSSTPTQPTDAIPAEYTSMYTNLKTSLDQFGIFLDDQGTAQNQPIFGAELLPANCNRGEELLRAGVLSGVKLYLDRLQELGVQGVTIPTLYPRVSALR